MSLRNVILPHDLLSIIKQSTNFVDDSVIDCCVDANPFRNTINLIDKTPCIVKLKMMEIAFSGAGDDRSQTISAPTFAKVITAGLEGCIIAGMTAEDVDKAAECLEILFQSVKIKNPALVSMKSSQQNLF